MELKKQPVVSPYWLIEAVRVSDLEAPVLDTDGCPIRDPQSDPQVF